MPLQTNNEVPSQSETTTTARRARLGTLSANLVGLQVHPANIQDRDGGRCPGLGPLALCRPEGAQILSVTSRKGASQVFTALDREVPPGPPDVARIISVIRANGVTPGPMAAASPA